MSIRKNVIKLPEEAGLAMILIPGGTFTMGSPKSELGHERDEEPQHIVTLEPFLMGEHLITQHQWRAVASLPKVERELDSNPSRFERGKFDGHYCPVEGVSWDDAVEFCARLSAHSGQLYTLPSEAQWEYACRAGTESPFYFGDLLTNKANYNEFHKGPTDVGSFPPNAFGLYDMHGNVWEWCLDTGHDNYEGAPTDGNAWLTGGDSSRRIVRGGSWTDDPRDCRSACRLRARLDKRSDDFGFRIVSPATSTRG